VSPRPPATSARAVALQALLRIEDGAFANLVLPGLLERTSLPSRDRAFATELTYGTTRMRRACDWLLSPHVRRPLDGMDPPVRALLRLGAYQLAFARTPAHAAVSATVDLAPKSTKGLVNAVLRKVASTEPTWPDDATRLSYPDWIVERLTADLGPERALAALVQMNEPATVTERADGYVQDEASQLVAAYVAALPGPLTLDVCAAPGGKATAIAAAGGFVAAADVGASRARLVAANAKALHTDNLAVVRADGRQPPFREASADRVLVDAPCSGLGVLRRRADARWRVQPADVDELAGLQRDLLTATVRLVRPGGVLVYCVCTLTLAETSAIDEWLAGAHPTLEPVPPPAGPWEPLGRGARLLPQTAGTDGMYVLALRAPDGRSKARPGPRVGWR
jgi:16S rRNA (cytosine967-C5)-methyltransferase